MTKHRSLKRPIARKSVPGEITFLEAIQKNRPNIYKALIDHSREAQANCGEADGEHGTWHSVKALPPSKQRPYLERALVYTTVTSIGPDIAWDRMGPLMARVRKVCPDIIDAFEHNRLSQLIEPLVIGRQSDRYRSSADRYY